MRGGGGEVEHVADGVSHLRGAREKRILHGMNATAVTTSAAIWERTIQPSRRSLDRAAARAILSLKLSARDLNRADALAEKCAAEKMTAAEAAELENYRSVGTALEFLKAKARLTLKSAAH